MIEKVLFTWSGGKDSAMACHAIQAEGQLEIAALLTTLTRDYDRISMHGVRRDLLQRQAQALGLDLEQVLLSKNATNSEYEEKMRLTLERRAKEGVRAVAFGDLFLEDIRAYREDNLSRIGMKGLFPLWGRDSRDLARSFLKLGFRAVVVCVDTKVLDRSHAGLPYDEAFVQRLPRGVDPAGENGEFHTFVFDGPIFHNPVSVETGEVVVREGFAYCDLLPSPDKHP